MSDVAIPSPAGVVRKLFRGQVATKPPKEDVGSIGLYGLSKAGKTVYLTMLFREASLDTQEPGRPKFKLQSRHLDTLKEMHHYRELLEGGSEIGRPAFPTSTTVTRLYRFDAIINRRYRYPFRTMDYKGEGLDVHHTSGTEETIEFLSSCHCLLFLYEPDEQMLDRHKEEADRAEPERRRRIELFTNMIANLRTEKTHRVKLDMPIGLVITKADKLEGFHLLEERDTVLLKGSLANAKFTDANNFIERVLAQEHIRRHRPWHRQVRRILTGLTYFWDEILDSAPAFQVFFASSTGGTETIINDKGVEEVVPPAQLQPKGVLTPFHWVVDMLETRRRVKQINHVALRWILIPTLVLHLVMLGLTLWVLHERLGQDLQKMRTSPSGKSSYGETRKAYRLYPGVRARLKAAAGATRIRNNLEVLFERSRGTLPDAPPTDDDQASKALRRQVEDDLKALGALPSMTPTVREVHTALAQLERDLNQAVHRTIQDQYRSPRFTGDKAEQKAQRLGEYYALQGDLGEEAADWLKVLRTGNVQVGADALYGEILRLVATTSVANQDLLRSKIKTLSGILDANPDLLSAAERSTLDEIQNALERVADMTAADAAGYRNRYPLIAAIVDDRLSANQEGGAANANPGGDPGFLKLAAHLKAREPDLVAYYTDGMPRAQDYVQETGGSPDPSVQAGRAAASAWLEAIARWQNEGLSVRIRTEDLGSYRNFYQVLGVGDNVVFDGPFTVGTDVEVRWRLGRPPADPTTGVRLYFSPSGDPPARDEQANVLRSTLTVVLGLSELLGGKAVLVGARQTPVRFTLVGDDALPRLAQ